MSLENVKVGDWIKVQVTDINSNPRYPIRCGNELSFSINGNYSLHTEPVAFPLEPTERWMMVSDSGKDWLKRKVIMEKNGYFLTWAYFDTDEKINQEMQTSYWKYAKEIEEVSPVEVTLEEIAEKFGINVEQIKIKK